MFIHDEYCYEAACLHPIPAYTLEDILMKLPKYLYGKELKVTKTEVSYQYLHYCRGYTLMRNAFEVLKWVLENHPDKIKRI